MTEHQPEPAPSPAIEPSDPWPHSPYPHPQPVLAPGGRRRWVAAAAATAVLATAAFVTALAWPRAAAPEPDPDPAAGFRPLEQRWQIDAAEPSGNTFSQVVGGRAYLGWQQGDDLALAAVDLATGEPVWQARLAGAAGQYWGGLVASAEAVVAYGYPFNLDDSGELAPADPVPMVVLDAGTGGRRYQWDREVHRDDEAWLAGRVLVLVDRRREALLGLHLDTGGVAWSVPFPAYPGELDPDEEDEGTPAMVVPVLTEEHLDAPSTWWGAPVGVGPRRLVLIGADRTARLIDPRDGQVIGTVGTNVADPYDEFLAYQDRLFVTSGQEGYQIYARELTALAGQPELVYTTPDPDRSLAAPLTPCGQWRICVLDQAGPDGAANQVRAVDVAPGRTGDPQRWSHRVPFAYWLVATGDRLLAGGDTALLGYDPRGRQVLSQPDGAAARIGAGRLLLSASVPGDHPQDLSLAGLPASGDRVELGQLPEVHGERCSWNDAYVVCPAEQGAAAWQFADPAG